jgi:CheY-like chemotaxis protein
MGHKILLADDSITIQKVVNLTFSDEGIEVVTVGNGELAVRRLNEVQPDIVLADIYMPGKSGYEVCEYIKTNPQYSHIPVLLLVGAFEPFDPTEAARVKADGHLTKPFESRALVATVNRLIASSPKKVVTSAPTATQTPSWQSVPPDAVTTKLSPEVAARYQASFSPEMQKIEPFIASPVTPIQANPVFPASPVTPIQASPVFPDSFAPPKPEPAFPLPSPANSFVDKVFSFDDNNSASIATVSEETSDKMELEIDRGPVFDLDAPPQASEPTFELELSDDTYNTSERKASSTVAFDLNANTQPPDNQTQIEKSVGFAFSHNEEVIKSAEPIESMQENQDDEFESTKIMGSASRKELLAAYSAYSSSAPSVSKTEDHKDMSLDVDFSTEQSPSFEVNNSVETEDLANVSEDNYSYDDFSPLELEPLEEIGYSQTHEQSNSTASTPHTTDELPAISDEYVFESTTSEIKREPLLDIEEVPASETPKVEEPNLVVGRITSSQDIARVTETIPQIPEPIATQAYTQEIPALTEMYVSQHTLEPVQHKEELIAPDPITDFDYSDPILNIPDVVSTPMPLNIENSSPTTITNEEDPLGLESQDHPLEIDESPSQFELEQAPTHYYTESLSSNYNSIAEEPLADLVTPENVSNTLESQPNFETNTVLEPVLELPKLPEIPPIPVSKPTFVEEENLPTATDLVSANAFVSSPIIALPPISTSPSLVETNTIENSITKPVIESDNQTTVTTITSIDQIPQHLIDQIVQRVISQLSESVVREIAWEVVPDLAEILIKKQLEKKIN